MNGYWWAVAVLVAVLLFVAAAGSAVYVDGWRRRRARVQTRPRLLLAGDKNAGRNNQGAVVRLRQADFARGTYRILQPGTYVLMEDIVFDPRPRTEVAHDVLTYRFPDRSRAPYDDDAYRLGFFAAVTVQADDVVLDLNGFGIGQSAAHYALQRFFAVVELADQPFAPKDGPFSAGDELVAASRCTVKNGRLGLSSHYGIHGNSNTHVTLRDLVIESFEVAAIHLNGGKHVTIQDVVARDSSRKVPFKGTFSAAINLLRETRSLSQKHGVKEPWFALRALVQIAFDRLQQRRPDRIPALFANLSGLPDGSMLAGVILHDVFKVGVIANSTARCGGADATLTRVKVENLRLKTKTVTTVLVDPTTPAKDIRGAVLDLAHQHTPLAKLQLALAAYKARHAHATNTAAGAAGAGAAPANGGCPFAAASTSAGGCPNPKTTPHVHLLDPHKVPADFYSMKDPLARYQLMCGHDIMHHAVKGVFGFKFDGVCRVKGQSLSVARLHNETVPHVDGGMCDANMDGQPVAITGIFVSDCLGVAIRQSKVQVDDKPLLHQRKVWVCNSCTDVSVRLDSHGTGPEKYSAQPADWSGRLTAFDIIAGDGSR
jgi:hypothetical protein